MALGVAPVAQRFESPREMLGDRLKGVYRFGDGIFVVPHACSPTFTTA